MQPPSYEDQIRMLAAQQPQKGLPQQVDPAVALMQAYQAYRGAHGGQEDPLAARAAQVQGPAKGTGSGDVRLLTGAGGADPFQTTMQGPRAGQTRQSYDLGDGRMAHVYYTPQGKRKVFVFAKGPGAPAA